MYRLISMPGGRLVPDDVALRLRSSFRGVSSDASEADAINASFLEKFRLLRNAGLGSIGPDAEQLVLDERSPGKSLLIRVWEAADERAFVQMLVLPGASAIDLQFSETVPPRSRKGLAKRLADALDCQLEALDDD